MNTRRKLSLLACAAGLLAAAAVAPALTLASSTSASRDTSVRRVRASAQAASISRWSGSYLRSTS